MDGSIPTLVAMLLALVPVWIVWHQPRHRDPHRD